LLKKNGEEKNRWEARAPETRGFCETKP
jgi:hypothetical protein